MSLILSTTTAAVAGTPDEAAIKTAVESVATLADSRNFESLEKLYAGRVRVDYTSAFGGEVEVKTPQALMTAWAGLLPGFDRTRHAISNVQVKVDGSMAAASAEVTADHWIAGRHWQVTGSYDYSFTNIGGEWRITAMTFHLKNEAGTREVLGHAANAANSRPVSYLERQRTQQAVRDFLTSLEEQDMSKFASVWAEDAVQDMPYSPEGFPKRVEGKANLVKHYAAWPENSGKANFTKELVFYPSQDPHTVFVEYRGVCEIKPTGRVYDQRYGGLFRVENGKIKLFREYYNPAAFAYAFGLNEGGNLHGNK